MLVNVILLENWSDAYLYKCSIENNDIKSGSIVLVPLKNRAVYGIVESIQTTYDENFLSKNNIYDIKKLKSITSLTSLSIPEKTIEYIKYISATNFSTLGQAAKTVISKETITSLLKNNPIYDHTIFKENEKLYTLEELIAKHTYQKAKSMFTKGKINPVSFDKAVQINPFDYLTSDQKAAADSLASQDHSSNIFLLEGATGSGKTDVYLEALGKMIEKAKIENRCIKILILLPEISLTNTFISRFIKKFSNVEAELHPMIWHHQISKSAKLSITNWSLNSDKTFANSGILIGARSAAFLPFNQLDCIIIDEEHDSTYKQNEYIRYNVKHCLIKLSKIHSKIHANSEAKKCPIILVSATPSLSHFRSIPAKHLNHIKLERKSAAGLPEVKIIDMNRDKEENAFVSPQVLEHIQKSLDSKELSLLFLNRKGYAPIAVCFKCKSRVMCKNCSVGMIYYKSANKMVCHYCNYQKEISNLCENCGNTLSFCGLGIEKVEEIVRAKFPDARIRSVSAALSKTEIKELHDDIKNKKIDILIGTQMLAQGHHIQDLNLACILDSDFSLSYCDYQSAEKTYQMLVQVAGRSGRGDKKGLCLIQTHFPDHPLLQQFKNNKLDDWKLKEIETRKKNLWPPFVNLLSIIVESTDDQFAQAYMKKVEYIFRKYEKSLARNAVEEKMEVGCESRCSDACGNNNIEEKMSCPSSDSCGSSQCDNKDYENQDYLKILGPIKAPLSRIDRKYRYRLLIKYQSSEKIAGCIDEINGIKLTKHVKIIIDNHPENFS